MAFKPKEARPLAGSSASPSTHKAFSTGGYKGNSTRKDDGAPRRPFSKPGAGAGGVGQFDRQGFRPSGAAPARNAGGYGAAPARSAGGYGAGSGKPQYQHPKPTGAASAPAASTASDMFAAEDETVVKPAKVKKPKVPKAPLDPNEHISQRAFIGGLAKDVTSNDVEGRFKSFGQLKDVYLAKDVDGTCRGFGYVTMDTTRKDWQKCMALFNGAKWKGHVLKIEEANKDWHTKRQEDLEAQVKAEKKVQDAIQKKFKRNPVKYAEDMSLITDKNMDGKRGWKRGRFGRPVITMKMEKMTYDPSQYKNNVEKLFNLSGKPLPLDQLVYQIDENEPLPKGKHLPTEVALAPFLSRLKPIVAPSTTVTADKTKSIADAKKEKSTAAAPTKATATDSERSHAIEKSSVDTSDDRAMMASILAGIDMSPRALSLDGSDFEDDEEGGARGSYMEDFGGSLEDTQADDLFGDVVLEAPAKVLSKAERESRPEDLFGDDEDEDESQANQPSLDFLDDEEDDEEGEYEEGGYEENGEEMEMESAEDDDEEEEEEEVEQEEEEEADDEEDDDDAMDEDTINAIAHLQGTSSTSAGGLFDSDEEESESLTALGDDQDTKSAKIAEESNTARIKALEAREVELDAAREKQQLMIASTLANIDSRDKKDGHVVFSDSDDYDSEDYAKIEADHAQKIANLNKPAKSIFDSDSGSDEEAAPTAKKTKKSGAKEMFASDDEDEEVDLHKLGGSELNIKEQFEGPGGRALFQMQSKIGTSDSRFQLTKDFMDDRIRAEDDVDFVAHQDRLKGDEFASSGAAGIVLDEDRQTESNVSAEKMQAMNVLRAMFGDSAVRSKKKEEDTARQAKGGIGYTTGLTVRYDPDAAPPPIVQSVPTSQDSKKSAFDSEDEESSKVSSDQDKDESEDEVQDVDEDELMEDKAEEVEEIKPVKKSVGFSFAFDANTLNDDDKGSKPSAPPVKKDGDITTQFQVASDLKALFAPDAGTFRLFGGEEEEEEDGQDGDVEDDRQGGAMDEDRSKDEILTSYTDGSRTIFASGADALTSGRAPLSHSGSMFFFHFNDPALLKRSNFKINNKVFMRTSTMDEVTAQWEKTRHTMTQEFKRKHKSASRNKARASKRFKSDGAPGGDHS